MNTPHPFVKRPTGECVWCKKPREAHREEVVKDENGAIQRVAIEEKKR